MNSAKIGVAAAGLAGAILTIALTWNLGFWAGYSPGPALFPVSAAVACGMLALLTMREAASERTADDDRLDKAAKIRVALTIGSLWAFAFLLDHLGFVIAMVLLMAVLLLLVLRQRLLPSLVTILLTVGTLHLIFIEWLHLALPRGPLGF